MERPVAKTMVEMVDRRGENLLITRGFKSHGDACAHQRSGYDHASMDVKSVTSIGSNRPIPYRASNLSCKSLTRSRFRVVPLTR